MEYLIFLNLKFQWITISRNKNRKRKMVKKESQKKKKIRYWQLKFNLNVDYKM